MEGTRDTFCCHACYQLAYKAMTASCRGRSASFPSAATATRLSGTLSSDGFKSRGEGQQIEGQQSQKRLQVVGRCATLHPVRPLTLRRGAVRVNNRLLVPNDFVTFAGGFGRTNNCSDYINFMVSMDDLNLLMLNDIFHYPLYMVYLLLIY